MNKIYNEIKNFFENPVDNMEKFFNSRAITWIDWREYDEDIISYFNGLLPQEDIVDVEIKEIKLGRGIDIILKKGNKTLTIPYEDDRTDRDITIKLTKKAMAKIVEDGSIKEYGARPLKRSIQKNIEDLLSEELLRNPELTGTINIDYKNDNFVVKKTKR